MSNPKTILLTGASGFLGSYLLEALIQKGYNIVVLKRSTSNLWRILHLNGLYKAYDVDIEPVEKAFLENKIDYVIHTACSYGRNGDSITNIVKSNLVFGLQILDTCIKFNIDTFFNTDTFFNRDTVIQSHLNFYTLSKKQFVDWLKINSEKINVVNLKIEHMYGPKDDKSKFVSWLVSQLESNVEEIKLTEGEQKRDFIYIGDVVTAYLAVVENRFVLNGFNEFDIGTGNLVSIKEFVNKVKDIFEYEFRKVKTTLIFGAIPYRQGEIMNIEVKNQTLLNLGWSSKFSLAQGLRLTIEDKY